MNRIINGRIYIPPSLGALDVLAIQEVRLLFSHDIMDIFLPARLQKSLDGRKCVYQLQDTVPDCPVCLVLRNIALPVLDHTYLVGHLKRRRIHPNSLFQAVVFGLFDPIQDKDILQDFVLL